MEIDKREKSYRMIKMGDTRDYLDSICDNCDHIDECDWDSPEECPYSDFG